MGREYLDEDRYRIAAEETGAAVFEWDLKTGAFYRSDSYLRYALSDVGADEILHNRGPLEMVHPQDTPALFRFFDEIKGGVARAEAVMRLKMKDGSYRWSRLVGIFCKDAQGAPSRTIGTIIDINDNYEKNMMIEGLLNAIPGGIAVYKVGAKLSCLYYSDGLPALSHRTREEFDAINGSPDALERLIAPEDIDRFRAVAVESVTKRKPIILNFRCIDADGSSFWLHLSATPIREEEGCPLYYAVFTAPEQESSMYQGLVADSRTAVLVAERDTRTVLYINNALLRFFPGAEKTKLSGMKTAEIFPDKRMLMTNEQMASLSETEYSEYSLKINDGRYFCLRCRALTWLGRPAYIQYISDETEAHRQEAELQELVDRIPSGIGIYDLRGDQVTLRYLNDGYFRMTDSTREERRVYAREKFFSAVHPDDVPRVLAALHKARENMEKIDVTLRVLNGKRRYLWVRLSAILTPTGKDTAVIYGCFTDVDEQVRQQEELTRKFEERTNYGKALARGSKASLLLNVTRNTVSEVESEEEPFSAFCLSHDGDTIFNYITAHIPYEAERARYRAIFTRRAIREAFERGETRCVIRHHYASASFWVESVCEAMQNPYTGDLEAYCFSRDVSDEKRAEDVVNRLVATEYDSIFTFDAESGVPRPFMNSSLDEVVKEQKKMGDVSAGVAEYLRRHSIDVDVERVVRDHSLCRVKEALEKVQSYSTFFTVRDDDGRPCYKRAAYSYMNEDKKNVVCSVRDVTAEYEAELNQRERLNKALAEATRANAAKTDFLSNMSHEIRTPMNAIIGMTKLAREELSNAAAADEYLAQIDASGQYLLGVINDILDMSRIESGKFTLSREWASPSAIALSCVEMMMPMAHEKNITFVYPQNLSCVGRYEFFVDVLKTKQMLMNLLNNAFKFTKAGGRVTLAMRHVSHDESSAVDEIIIEDDGCGMSQEFLTRAFTPFEQERNIYSGAVRGTGLGLALAKRIAMEMGGDIKVESELGLGSKFTVSISYLYREKESAAPAGEETMTDLFGKKILLAEDQPLNSIIAKKLLEKRGMTVHTAENGKEALRLFAESASGDFDAILMDVRMPVMDGLAATRAIRALPRADAKSIAIIAMTANAFEEDRKASLDAGMNAHLTKPVNPKLLYETIAGILK